MPHLRKALSYLEVDLPRCVLTHGVAPCGAVLGFLGTDGALAADFDGANDYMTRGAGLTGAADGKVFGFSVWFVLDALSGRVLSSATTVDGATERLRIQIASSRLNVVATNAAGTTILDVSSSVLVTGKLYHVAGFFDMAGGAARRALRVNGKPDLALVATYTDAAVDLTLADWSVGARPSGADKINGRIADLWLSAGEYLHLDDEETLRRFVTAAGNPVFLGSTGQLPTGVAPLVFLSSPTPDTSFGTNKGTGGNFAVTGALTAAAATGTQPCFNSPGTCQDLAAFSTGKMDVAEVVETVFDTDATSHAVAMPSTVKAGDGLVAVVVTDGAATVTTPSGWTSKGTAVDAANEVRLSVLAKDAGGTEGGTTVDFVTSAAEKAVAQVYRVRDQEWFGGVASVEVQVTGEGSTNAPTPPGITPSWGAHEWNLFIAAAASSRPDFPSSYPALFADFKHTRNADNTAAEVGLATASRLSPDATVTPGAFALTGTPQGVVAATIAVRPASVAPTTVRFSRQADYYPRDVDALACVIGDDYSPAAVALGSGTGERASLSVALGEAPHSDAGPGYDPYLSQRAYVPYRLGTHWAKFRARWPGLQGAPCRLRRGFVGQALDAMETRHLFVESTSGPTVEGVFSLVAKDALKFLDGDRAQAPRPSPGRLSAAINEVVLAATLAPAGIGTRYRTQGHLAIGGKEIVAYERSGDALTLTARGALGTPAEAHNAGDRVQEVLRYQAQSPATIIADLEINYAGVPPESVGVDDWETEVSAFLNQVYTATVAEPTPVRKLVAEMLVNGGLVHWWDDEAEQARLQVLRTIGSDASVLDGSVYARRSLSIQEQPDKRVSRVLTFFGQRNPLEPLDDPSNYRNAVLTIDADAELRYGGVPAITKIFSRFIADGGLVVAERLNEVVLSRFNSPPRRLTFDVARGGSVQPRLGGGYRAAGHPLQDAHGDPILIPVQVTGVRAEPDRLGVTAEEQTVAVLSDLDEDAVVISASQNNVNLQEMHDLLYPPATSGDTVRLVVQSGVVVGSTSHDEPALDIGTFAGGVAVIVENGGRLQGRGGKGGRGGGVGGAGGPGKDGGVALHTRQAITYDGASGEIWGGAGGGGGGGNTGGNDAGGGGGGGGGTLPGVGGDAGGGNAKDGKDGTAEAGGNGGDGAPGGPDGGNGGNPGNAGQAGSGPSGGAAGGAGAAVDGWSFVTVVGSQGDIRGSTIN